MSGEYTFQFTPTQGEIIFSHEWSLRCYNVWGKYTGSGTEGNIHLPYDIQLKVKNMWGKQNFGRLYIEAKAITPNSITVKYWIKCYHPGEWYNGLTYSGKLTCATGGGPETETLRTYSTNIFEDANLETRFPLESWIWVQASDGVTQGGTRDCFIRDESGKEIVISLKESSDAPGYYRGAFYITSGPTNAILVRIHLDEFGKADLRCDVNGDDVFSHWVISAVSELPGPQIETTRTYVDSTYIEEAAIFPAEATCYVWAAGPYSGNTGGTRDLRVVADSGDVIHVTLTEETFFNFKGSFLVTNGSTNDELNRIHLEEGEAASLYVDINGDGVSPYCRIARTLPSGEAIYTYENPECTNAQDVFDHETTVYVDATALAATDGTRILDVQADSGDKIQVTLEQHLIPTHFRGSFKVTNASTDDDLDQIHLDIGEKAILSCDVNQNGESASCEIWCITKVEIDETYATHYRIQVNTQIDMLGTMMWDSQKCLFSDPVALDARCPDIEYAGSTLDLSGKTTYWWRIKFWINFGTEETLWSSEEAYFRGIRIVPPIIIPPYDDDIRKPRSKVEVEIEREWIDLQKVTTIQISNNKNPLDNIETTQGTVYLSNIDQEFYPDKSASQFFNQLFGRRIRMSLGFLDYKDTEEVQLLQKMMGIVKNVTTDRAAQTAEIVALEFMDYYRTKEIKITPVYENLSLFELYCALITYCFPSWLNQHETADWDYWVDPLGFRRTNIYIGTGKIGGSEFIPIRDFSRTPPEWIYSIVPDSEALYDDEGFRLKRGEDYEIILKETDKGTESWIHFLKLPYPTSEDGFYIAIIVDIRVSVVQYKDTTLLEELEDIALVADCRLYADEYGRLICKSNELEEEVTDTISHDKNLMALSTRKDIDSITNHVVVESRPYQIGADVEIGIWEITFSRRPEAEKGKEFDFVSDEFVENFRFDLTWNLQCSQWLGDCVGFGSETNIELPFTSTLPLAGAIGCTKIYGHLYIEPVAFDSNHITVKFYLDCIHDQHYDNAIVFSATLTCRAGGIGQPETYKGEAIDEASYQDRYIGRRKRTFTLDYLEPGDTQARQAAERILMGLRKIRTYYDCGVRGMPHLRLMDTVTLTEPKANLSQKKLQVIKLVDSMEVANYMGEVGLMERKIPSAVPWYWETAEQDFIINTREQLIQTFKFIFDSEIISYKFGHNYSVDASTTPYGFVPLFPSQDCHGEGADENFDLPYTLSINVYSEQFPDIPWPLGTLTISLIEATSTSIEVQYTLEVPEAEHWLWPIDWLGTLSVKAQFASQSPGTDGGDAPPDQPHYPPDEPDTPPDDEPDDGWEYEIEDYSDIRGLLTSSTAPDLNTFRDLGFNLVLPFNTSAAIHLGRAGVPMIGNGAGGAWYPGSGAQCTEEECHLFAYFMADEPSYRGISADSIISWARRCRSQTNLPITCTFAADAIVTNPGWGFDRVIPELDFVCITCYFYRGGGLSPSALNYGKGAIEFVRGFGKPIVGIAQGSEEPAYGTSRPDLVYVNKFWRERGCGIIWYGWNIGAASIGNRPGDTWYNNEIRKINQGKG
ncbi:hypothetical protein ES703_01618 [subsurface metagenome]